MGWEKLCKIQAGRFVWQREERPQLGQTFGEGECCCRGGSRVPVSLGDVNRLETVLLPLLRKKDDEGNAGKKGMILFGTPIGGNSFGVPNLVEINGVSNIRMRGGGGEWDITGGGEAKGSKRPVLHLQIEKQQKKY